MADETSGQAFEEGKDKAGDLRDKADSKEREALDVVKDVQQATVGQVTPVPTEFDAVSSPSDLKDRLNWGEPALSILDVRDRLEFNKERITGAMPMPTDKLVEMAKTSFEASRDLFIYGDSDEQSTEAATQLQSAGFNKVSVIKGGLPAWKAIGGPVEGQVSV